MALLAGTNNGTVLNEGSSFPFLRHGRELVLVEHHKIVVG